MADLIVLAPFLSLSQSESVPGIAAHSLLDGFLSQQKKTRKTRRKKRSRGAAGELPAARRCLCGIFRYMCHTYSLFSRGTRASRRGTRAGRVAILYGVRSVARARHRRLSPMPLQNAHAGHDRRPRRRRGPLSAQRSHRIRAHIIASIAAMTPSLQASIGSRGGSRTTARDDDSAQQPLPLTPPRFSFPGGGGHASTARARPR